MRFTLRTLIAVVTLICLALGWLMWQRNIVREREELLVELAQRSIAFVRPPGNGMVPLVDGRPPRLPDPPLLLEPSIVRRWLGDSAIAQIHVFPDIDPRNLERIRTVFPETQVCFDLSRPGQ